MDEVKQGERVKKSLYDRLNDLLNKDKSQQSQIDTMSQIVHRAQSQIKG